MKPISELLASRSTPKKGPNSERADVVEQLCAFMGEDTKRMKYWLGRTRKLDPQRIYQLMGEAKQGDRPRALFNFLLKKELNPV